MSKSFYEIKNKADESAEIWIYDQIGEDWFGEGVTAKNLVKELSALKVKNLDVRINSPGGSVFDGQAIYNALKAHPAKVTTYIDGVAASIASVIALAGDSVVMAENALFMVHNPWSFAQGGSAELRKVAEVLDKVRDTILGVYRERTGLDDDKLTALMDEETWMSATEARDLGFVDDIAGAMDIAASFDMSKFKNAPIFNHAEPVAEPGEAQPMTPVVEEDNAMAVEETVVTPVGSQEVSAGVSYDAAEIAALCAAHNLPVAKVADFLARKLTVDQTAKEILAMVTTQGAAGQPAAEKSDINFGIGNEIRRYSLFKAAMAQASGDWRQAGFEAEVSAHLAKSLGHEPKGFMLPYSIFNVMTSGGTNTGAELVGTDHLADQFIDALRARTVMGRAGATVLAGLVGDVDIPKLTSSGTFYMVAEDSAPTVSTPGTGSVTLSPKSASAAVHLSRKLLKQSAPSVEAMIRNDLLKGVANCVDNECINGTGADNRPLGILLTPSVNTSVITSAGNPDWDEIVAFETAIAADNADVNTMYFITTPAVRGAMKVKPKFTSTGLPIWADDGTVNGYGAMVSTQVPSNGIIFGDFSSLLIGMWGAVDLVVDTATDISKGGIVLRPWVEFDLGVRHVESFCINA